MMKYRENKGSTICFADFISLGICGNLNVWTPLIFVQIIQMDLFFISIKKVDLVLKNVRGSSNQVYLDIGKWIGILLIDSTCIWII